MQGSVKERSLTVERRKSEMKYGEGSQGGSIRSVSWNSEEASQVSGLNSENSSLANA